MPETREYTLPVYWASYLINGDASGLEDGEQKKIDRWLAHESVGPCVDVSEDAWFQWHCDASGLGGDVSLFTFLAP